MSESVTFTVFAGDPTAFLNAGVAADYLERGSNLDPTEMEAIAEGIDRVAPYQGYQFRQLVAGIYTPPTNGSISPENTGRFLGGIVRRISTPSWQQAMRHASAKLKNNGTEPTPSPLPTLAEIFAKEPKPRAGFDPFKITLAQLQPLPEPHRLTVQIQIFRCIEEMLINLFKTVVGLSENERGNLEGLQIMLLEWRSNILYLLDGPFSGMSSGPSRIIDRLRAILNDMQWEHITWKEGMDQLEEIFTMKKFHLTAEHGFYSYLGRERYAKGFIHWLAQNITRSEWQNEGWLIVAPAERKENPLWPPDKNDLHIQTILEMLGWTIDVEARGDQVVIDLHFGNWRF